MTLTDNAVALATTFLPLDLARRALLPPVRLARSGSVVLARTVRHWELLLEDGVAASDEDALRTDRSDGRPAAAPEGEAAASMPEPLPVADWAELSYADAQARLGSCDESDLRALLEYERAHGHRVQYTLLLEQRLSQSA